MSVDVRVRFIEGSYIQVTDRELAKQNMNTTCCFLHSVKAPLVKHSADISHLPC